MYNRLGRGERVFEGGEAADEFVGLLRDVVVWDELTVFAWCLMPNHYHMAVRMGRVSLGQRPSRGALGGGTMSVVSERSWACWTGLSRRPRGRERSYGAMACLAPFWHHSSACPEIRFQDSVFCFTGQPKGRSKAELAALAEDFGGSVAKNMRRDVDYLVIGSEGSKCWAFSCYGRKVEAAMKLRREGLGIMLVHEFDFLDVVEDHR